MSTWTEYYGGITITSQNNSGAGGSGTPWTLEADASTPSILKITGTINDDWPEGLVLQFPSAIAGGFISGSWFTITIQNLTGTTWTTMRLELQNEPGSASGDIDGLSFAQGAGLTYTSSKFATVTQESTTEDSLTFSDGSVANGETVNFHFAVTDNDPHTPLFLLLTPDPSGGGGSGYRNTIY